MNAAKWHEGASNYRTLLVPSSVESRALNLAENVPYKVSSMFPPTSLRSREGLVLRVRIHSSTIWPKQGAYVRMK